MVYDIRIKTLEPRSTETLDANWFKLSILAILRVMNEH